MKAPLTDRFHCSISTCSWYFDTPALPTAADVARSLQVGVEQSLSERARGIDTVLREHFQTHTLVEWMTEVNQRQVRADKAEAELDRLRAEVQRLQRPLLAVQADADPNDDDADRWRTKYMMTIAGRPHHAWLLPTGAEVRLEEWTIGNEFEPYDASHVYNEADARHFAADPDSGNVLWRREATPWAKAKPE